MIRNIACACTALSVAALLSGCAAPRYVDTASGERKVTVNYGDLDLSRPAGAQVLLTRVRTASELACGTKPSFHQPSRVAAYNACIDHSMDDAVRIVNQPLVADLYGKPKLVAETRPIDASLATAEIPPNTVTVSSQASHIGSNPTKTDRTLADRIGGFFSDLFR